MSATGQCPPPAPVADAAGPLDFLLLMKPPEAAFVAAALHRIRPTVRIARAENREELLFSTDILAPNARLIAFSTAVIVPAAVLEAFKGNAYNFHPGPPEYPGNRPSGFACYEGARTFGCTLHRMLPRVDEGEIVDCLRFSIAERSTAARLAITAYQNLAKLFIRNAVALAQNHAPLPANGAAWGHRKTTQAEFDAMREVPGDIDPEELDRRIRSFNWIYTPL